VYSGHVYTVLIGTVGAHSTVHVYTVLIGTVGAHSTVHVYTVLIGTVGHILLYTYTLC